MIVLSVCCDAEGCRVRLSVQQRAGTFAGTPLRLLRVSARRAGWRCHQVAGDYCPAHTKENR